MAKKKIECDCCGCDDKEEKKTENLKVYFCPKCKSNEVRYIFGLKNIFGLMPTMRCEKCGFQLQGGFPQITIPKNKLNKNNAKNKLMKKNKR